MSYKLKIARLEKQMEEGKATGLVIGVTLLLLDKNGIVQDTIYRDWVAKLDEFNSFPPSKTELWDYIKKYLNKTGEDNPVPILKSMADSLKSKITYEDIEETKPEEQDFTTEVENAIKVGSIKG